jgi:hypothetical protein
MKEDMLAMLEAQVLSRPPNQGNSMLRVKANIRRSFEIYLEIILVTCRDSIVYNFINKEKAYGLDN